jgi:hypothetical protein
MAWASSHSHTDTKDTDTITSYTDTKDTDTITSSAGT